ncbi:dixin-like isoform X3 [Erpetoichthys calabaricus]|uniref:dixin-like isoform X3 n=1 Tax=Erpetoichthys calabaricus TaxID=27687 RepID=UPI00223406B9|nr:dixin-like isoform X3 [Erpetoichthys calabaricus]
MISLSRGNLLDVLQEGFNEQQLQAYVTWVNSQLRKKPEVKMVQDLRQDLRDGVILAHLVEIVAGEHLSDIHYHPTKQQEMKENVEKILQFVASKHIRMHQTSARDIVEGNLKSIMRLILALAAHFKPSATGRSANFRSAVSIGLNRPIILGGHRPNSTTAMVQNAVATLAAARQDASRSGRDIFRYRQERQRNSSVDEEIENPGWSVRALVQQYEGQKETMNDESNSEASSLSSPSPVHTVNTETTCSQSEDKAKLPGLQSEDAEIKTEESTKNLACVEWQTGLNSVSLDTSWEEQLLEQQDQLEKEMEEARKMISGLQALLLNGSLPEDDQEASFALGDSGTCPDEQLVIVRSRLDQSMEESQELKKELQKYKQETRNLQGVKDALQQRLAVQEAAVLQLKQELLRANMAHDELHSQNVDLLRKVEERNRLLGEYKKELGQKDRLLQQQQTRLDETARRLTDITRLKADLQRELDHKSSLIEDLMNRELNESAASSCSQNNGYTHPVIKGNITSSHRGPDDLQLVRDALRSLRNSFSGHDPQHHTIDTLEQSISSLMERLHLVETQKKHDKRPRGKSPRRRALPTERDSWPPSTKLPHSHSNPTLSTAASTKVLYFTDRSLTPFMVTIPKRLGEVTLKDFKAAIDREGNFRYHFKALDPEFGTVKEEVFHDEDIIPGWEGKIVAWIEDDHGDSR